MAWKAPSTLVNTAETDKTRSEICLFSCLTDSGMEELQLVDVRGYTAA